VAKRDAQGNSTEIHPSYGEKRSLEEVPWKIKEGNQHPEKGGKGINPVHWETKVGFKPFFICESKRCLIQGETERSNSNYG